MIDTVQYSLIPVRKYYDKYPDVVRLWISEQSTQQEEIRTAFDYAAKNALRGLGVDVRDGALTIKSAREHLYAKLAMERREDIQNERMAQLLRDTKLNGDYFGKIRKEMQ